jgi:hypothetical protein
MLRYHLYLFVASAIFANAALARLPNHTRTPGVTNPDVTQETIHQTICVSGWTATIRPPSNCTTKLKTQQIKEYRYKEKRLANPRRCTSAGDATRFAILLDGLDSVCHDRAGGDKQTSHCENGPYSTQDH